MKIKELRIGHFGKLHNVTIGLADGLNLIYGDNESGKSTVHAFIGAMLFGLDKNRGRAGKDDLYTRYQPWEAPAEYRGSMDFEHEGREYRITRVFYQKEKSCVLTELATGRRIPLADDSITSLIPKLTKSAYYNTVSMGQAALKCSDDFAGEVRNHIANLATTGGSKVDVPGALAVLEAKKKELQKELKSIDIEAIRMQESELLEKEQEAGRLAEKKKEILKEAAPLREKIAGLKESVPDTASLARERQQVKADADEAERKLREKENIIQNANAGTEHQDGENADSEIRRTRLNGLGMILLAVGALFCIAGNERSAVMIGIGVAILIVAIIMIVVAYIELRAERSGRSLFIDKKRDDTGNEADIVNGQAEKQEHDEYTTAVEKENRIVNIAESEVNNVSENGLEDERRLAEERYHEMDRKLSQITAKIDAATAERERIGGEILSLDESADELESLADRIEWELENMGDIGDELDICKHELRDANAKADALKKEIAAIEKAFETIGRVSAELHDSFSESFNELLSEEICLATDGKYSSGRVNDDLEIEIMSGIDYVPAGSLSTGAMQQLFAALRFAAARLLFGDTEVPILLDECFAYSDENRMKSALSALAEREGQQILLFTCRKDEKAILDELGAAYNLINMQGI